MTLRRRSLMATLGLALFYSAVGLSANADPLDVDALREMREGDMRKLVIHDAPMPLGGREFTDPSGANLSLAAYEGQVVLLNFWATWCAPCREEMPDLEALQLEWGGEDFQVVTIATGRNSLPGIKAFFAEVGIEALPILLDPRGQMARASGVLGLPVTVILDREGMEIGRLQGGAHWNTENARAILSEVIANQPDA
ncbi:thiol-disulfide isomerase/thioredoxin [Rubricella aquisinus]|uniref:Thiol-disulfide isomerase/thioredoxin n=1 Tax=Rubricella aquisinus TaxID=2028108 RepID=A0A840WPP9_9RHOB|nr:TlpA disulfide reductase family protein [Rubricella aquisinus]MBB5516043.1 thiol-disulfide isomerase/thioredoxin [Rubricella aquisinus]